MSNAFASVNTQPKREKNSLDPRATRYGLMPIWSVPVSARDFYVWKIPANQVFPFRPFIGEVGQDMHGKVLYTTERLPADQIDDMTTVSSYFIEFPELASFVEADVARVSEVLKSTKQCSKYPFDLQNSCATCWVEYIRTDARGRIEDELSDRADLKSAAIECLTRLNEGLQRSIEEARRLTDKAIRDIDDPKSGKDAFLEFDYLNVFHTHADRPQYRTTTSSTNAIEQLAEIISRTSQPKADVPGLDQIMAEMKAMREELAQYKAKESAPEVKVPDEDVPSADLKSTIAEKLKK